MHGMRTGRPLLALVLALVLVLAWLAGCASDPEDPGDSGEPTSPSASGSSAPSSVSPSGSEATSSPPATPQPTRYRPDPAEVDAAAKRTAARAVEELRWVRQVTYTQYFGYLPPSASILVEADFEKRGGTTYDVRISRQGPGWQVDSVTPAEPVPPLADPSRLIRRVLDSDRIRLPWAGRADVASGRIAEEVLRSMLAVAEQHEITISVLVSAHPELVFGTDRRSRHPDGFAYDIGSIDGRLVVDPRNRAAVRDVMRLATDTGADQVGGPEDLDGGGSQYFADLTHSDHVHVGFDG